MATKSASASNPKSRKTNDVDQYLVDIDHDVLSRDEEIALATKVASGDKQAREDLILHNLRLVVSVAKGFQNRGLSLEDLVGEGNIGLLQAADKFKPERGCRFSTYATYWIRQAIQAALKSAANTSKQVRVPSYMHDLISKAKHIMQNYEEKGVSISFGQAVRRMFLSDKKTKDIVKAAEVQKASNNLTVVGYDNDGAEDTINLPDHRTTEPHDIISSAEELQQLRDNIKSLPKHQARVITSWYIKQHTLERISRRMRISKAKARQLREEGMMELTIKLGAKLGGNNGSQSNN